MGRPFKFHLITIFLLILLGVILTGSYSNWLIRGSFNKPDRENPFGFIPFSCWFSPGPDWPVTECYYMIVPENHTKPDGRIISFPVVVFRSNSIFTSKSPVLHLGAGGPGAPMNFESTESVRTIWEYHDEMSLNQGRDLFVIDPRGTGLSEPLLTCDTFADNVLDYLKKNMTIEEELTEADKDYTKCINKFKSRGINFSTYNSLSISQDMEMMRIAANVDRWVLIGVSYSTIYAQLLATEYPTTVESMILDSAAFPNLKMHHNFVEQTLAPYNALYNYCDVDPKCNAPIFNLKQRIWNLYQELNQNPLNIEINHPYDDSKIPVVLNGGRFVAAILEGIYGESIFEDIPRIIVDLEARRHESIAPYLESHIAYLLDKSFGDVSAEGHYCYEDKPFTDFDVMRVMAQDLPEGYIRDVTLLFIDWPDYCNKMQIEPGDPKVAIATKTEIPSLFLHGKLDTVTPLRDVISQKQNFKNSRLVTYNLSHDILSSDECAENVAAKFIDDNTIDQKSLNCD